MAKVQIGPDYGWLITAETKPWKKECWSTAVGLMGPHNITIDLEKKLRKGKGRKFQLLKGKEVMFEGVILILDDAEENWDKAPLEDFGKCYANCTRINYP